MKKDINQNVSKGIENEISENIPVKNSQMSRRKFVELTAATAAAFTIMPRHVLGGKNYVAPSDKITLAYIGVGTQGIRELLPLLAQTQIQVVAVCDPNKEAIGYKDWGTTYLRDEIRKLLMIKTGLPVETVLFPVEEIMESLSLMPFMQTFTLSKNIKVAKPMQMYGSYWKKKKMLTPLK